MMIVMMMIVLMPGQVTTVAVKINICNLTTGVSLIRMMR